MDVIRLHREQILSLQANLSEDTLANYELLWVLDGCLANASSQVHVLGDPTRPAGILIMHRQCLWVRVNEERWLELLLDRLPSMPVYRFYTSEELVLDMLLRWFPGGEHSQTSLLARKVTKSWRKRFDVRVEQAEAGRDKVGSLYYIYSEHALLAAVSGQGIVHPYIELVSWQIYQQDSYYQWLEQVFGAVTSHCLQVEQPLIIRTGDMNLLTILESLGYKTFSPLFYYVAAAE